MTERTLILALHAQRKRSQTLNNAYWEQTQLINDLRQHNAELRARITRLEQSRDQWKHRATSYRPVVNRLRTRVTDARRSRDLWKTRALRESRE